jgi:hypothetical protein
VGRLVYVGAVTGPESLARFEEGFDDLDDFVLLAAREFLDLFENGADFAAGGGGALGLGLTKNLLGGDAEGLGDGDNQIGAGQVAGAFPITEIGGLFADLAGELAQGEARSFTKGTKEGTGGFGHGRSIRAKSKMGLHVCSQLHTHVQCNLT